MTEYSVKIKGVPFSPASGNAEAAPSVLGLKIKYARGAAGKHELDGLFDYTRVMSSLRTAVETGEPGALRTFLEKDLAAQLGDQGIPEAKAKFIHKSIDTPATSKRDGAEIRLEGQIAHVDIRHGNISGDTYRAEGDAVEPLSYVVKLRCEQEADAPAIQQLLEAGSPGVHQKIENCFHLLGEGRALEIVNGAIRSLLQEHLGDKFSRCSYKLTIKRPSLLQDAVVVIGEKGLAQTVAADASRASTQQGEWGHYCKLGGKAASVWPKPVQTAAASPSNGLHPAPCTPQTANLANQIQAG